MGDKESVKSKWSEYFKQLCNTIQLEEGQNEATRIIMGVKIAVKEPVEPPTKEDLEKALKALKYNNALIRYHQNYAGV